MEHYRYFEHSLRLLDFRLGWIIAGRLAAPSSGGSPHDLTRVCEAGGEKTTEGPRARTPLSEEQLMLEVGRHTP